MNKYQKAFDNIYSLAHTSDYYHDYDEKVLDIIEELVEKATLKKLIKREELSCASYLCPICENAYGDNVNNRKYIKYCPICGQKLDWSDEQ